MSKIEALSSHDQRAREIYMTRLAASIRIGLNDRRRQNRKDARTKK